jgi:hypothetical protein
MSGGIPQLPMYAFTARTETLTFSVFYLVMLSVTQAALHHINAELGRLWKEAHMDCPELHPSTDIDHLS